MEQVEEEVKESNDLEIHILEKDAA
jgi:hypothetical protein